MQLRICNRCSAQVPPQTAIVSLTIPPTDPATRQGQVPATPVTVDLSVQLLTPDLDLCPICLVSALIEYLLVAAKAELTATSGKLLRARLVEALGAAGGS